MNPLIYILSPIIFCFSLIFSVKGQTDKNPIELGATYAADVYNNFSGGLKTKSGYLGIIDLNLLFNTETAKLWKGGNFYIHLENTHGDTPTNRHVGDIQVFSNMENGNHTYLYELWYSQVIDNTTIILGKQDLNANFLTSDYAGEYINSSFGIMPVASLNVPAAIFPRTALAVTAITNVNESLQVQAAIFDGDPGNFETDMYSLNNSISKEEGYLGIGEIHIHTTIMNKPGTYKIGGFYHNAEFTNFKTSDTVQGNYGIYFIADQMVYAKNEDQSQGMGILFQIGYSPENISLNDLYITAGINYYGLIPGRKEDVLGLGMAHCSFSNSFLKHVASPIAVKSETVIELNYKLVINEQIEIQPDLQYINNPAGFIEDAGSVNKINDAFVGLIRFSLLF